MTDSPFREFLALLPLMPELSQQALSAVAQRDQQLTKPMGALGRLEEISAFLAGWQNKNQPSMERPMVCVFAGNHGVVAQGVSPFPASVTAAMVENFKNGGAAVNQICETYGLGLRVFELALEMPTEDITQGPAMDEKSCAATLAFGMEAIAGGADVLALGEMGIGNTTIAAAIYYALYGGRAEDWVGRGTGVDDVGLKLKIAAVEKAVALHRPYLNDPLQILTRLGGREVVAMAGAIMAARMERIPIVLDGYVVCAAAAVLHALDPHALDHCLAGHLSAEGAHAEVLRRLGKAPILSLGLRLGEGSGAALAMGVMKSAVACHNNMATFADAGVAGKSA